MLGVDLAQPFERENRTGAITQQAHNPDLADNAAKKTPAHPPYAGS